MQYILELSFCHTYTHTALCLSCGTYQTRKRLFVFPGISKHPQHKQVPLETGRGETHTVGAAALSLHRGLWCASERADNEGLLHLNSFNWSVDVTGCWYFVVIVMAWCELGTHLKGITALICTCRCIYIHCWQDFLQQDYVSVVFCDECVAHLCVLSHFAVEVHGTD